jgi:hypothetical protein
MRLRPLQHPQVRQPLDHSYMPCSERDSAARLNTVGVPAVSVNSSTGILAFVTASGRENYADPVGSRFGRQM